MRINKVITIITVAVIGLSILSCKKDNTIQYNNTTMGNVTNGIYISDQGNTFNIVEQTCAGKIDTMKRVLTVCDVLNKTEGGQENEYDVRMNLMLPVLVKDIIPAGTEDEESSRVNYPININQLWISGGYINMNVSFFYKESADAEHYVNLVQQESEEAGAYTFTLTHHTFEAEIEDVDMIGYKVTGGYVSFPINSFMKEDEAKLTITWTGFDTNNFFKTEEMKTEGRYKKDGFAQEPIITTASRVAIR